MCAVFASGAVLASESVVAPASDRTFCSDSRIVAGAIATPEDIQAFVRCAAEYVREHGTEEARRAFSEDEQWHTGSIYVFVDEIAASGEDSFTFVFPPDPSREGQVWGTSIDSFGTDYYFELHRILSTVDSGWIYYAFANPATGRTEPKSSYVIEIDWNGTRAAIGAGLYASDRPGTCNADEVNAAGLTATPSDRKMQEFVRCAALLLESKGYFAMDEFEQNSRWSHGSSYVYVMDMMGNQVMTSSRIRVNGNALHEWGGSARRPSPFDGRDIIDVGDSFGESTLYYWHFNPATGAMQRKVGMLKRVVAHGVPVLVGSGYYLDHEETLEGPSCSDHYVAAPAVRVRSDIRALVQCAAEYAAEHGPEETYRAFHDDPQWDHPQHYVFVRLLEQDDESSSLAVYPPDPTREGITGTAVHDIAAELFSDYYRELHRITDSFDSGWIHYYFINQLTGTVEPKSSYFIEIDWNGRRAVVAAGIYERDLPATCHREQVNAAALAAEPSETRLREFVRCASAQVRSMGFFAGPALQSDARWLSGPVNVWVADATTLEIEFSGIDYDLSLPEFMEHTFGGRDIAGVVETFGEAYLYFVQPTPFMGEVAPEVGFVKRVLAQGVPLLVGSSYRPRAGLDPK